MEVTGGEGAPKQKAEEHYKVPNRNHRNMTQHLLWKNPLDTSKPKQTLKTDTLRYTGKRVT